jgi:predicted acetyltransferase
MKHLYFRKATSDDVPLLAAFNQQLIEDEGHCNRMTLPELEQRMQHWLQSEYQAILFEHGSVPVAYALYREEPDMISLRQFFVARQHRRSGVGRQAIQLLQTEVWPPAERIRVEVLVDNRRAYDFWKAVGFADYAITLEMT